MNRLTRIREATLKLGRERQIGVAVLGVLLSILVVVVIWRVRRSGEPDPTETAVIKDKSPLAPTPDAGTPTVVRPDANPPIFAHSSGLKGRIDAAPPSDPVRALDPNESTRRHPDEAYDPPRDARRVAQRTAPFDDSRYNPLRSGDTEEAPGGSGKMRDSSQDPAHSDVPPRRPLRRPLDDDDANPPSRRSAYVRTSDAIATAGDDAESPEANPLRKGLEPTPPAERRAVGREPVGREAVQREPIQREPNPRDLIADDVPPARKADAAARSTDQPRHEWAADSGDAPPRRTALSQRRPERSAAVPSRVEPTEQPIVRAAAASPETADALRTYVVHDGDTIYDIAQFELGRSARWVEIVALNRAALGDEIHFLKAGMKLTLPAGTGASGTGASGTGASGTGDRMARQAGDDSVR